jgi:hypothetical protein
MSCGEFLCFAGRDGAGGLPQTPVAEGGPASLKFRRGEPREGSSSGGRGARETPGGGPP